ncbi:MAG: DUF2752 domain-containing protein [Clostridia bacterium]|nr:DUF2752 domain-containing protein [Clostridia bacterium]
MEKRRNKVLIGVLILFAVGAAYTLFVKLTGVGIPCPVNLTTGLKCPGCGVSRMFLALFRFDFAEAFRQNGAILCLLPLMAATAARFVYVYVRRGTVRDRAAEVSVWFMVGVLLVFGVVRNVV